MRQYLLLAVVVLCPPAVVAADEPTPEAKRLAELADQPTRFLGVRVTVDLMLTGETTPAADGHPELGVTAGATKLDRLKFRAIVSLAEQLPGTGATAATPAPARLVGRVLGADAAGRGRYVVQVEEVRLLDPNGMVTATLKPRVEPKPEPKKAEPPPAPKAEVKPEPKPEPKPEAKPEPTPEPRPAEETGPPVLPVAVGGGVGLLLTIGVGVVALRRKKPAAVVRPPLVIDVPPPPSPADIGPLSVNDRLARRAR